MVGWESIFCFVNVVNAYIIIAYVKRRRKHINRELWYLQELEHDHAQEADEHGAVLETTEVQRSGTALVTTFAGSIDAAVHGTVVITVERQALVVESDVLRNALVVAVSALDVQAHEVLGVLEEHVLVLVEALEAGGVVGELVAGVGGGRVAQENALDLAGEVLDHLRVVLHDIGVAGVGDKDELALGESLEDAVEKELADGEGGLDVGEVERAGIEAAAGVGGVDELHVGASHLLGGGGQVVEVDIGQVTAPVAVDVRHVLPGLEVAGERVEEALFRVVNLGDAKNVVNVTDNSDTLRWHQVSGAVAQSCTLDVCTETLDLGSLVTRSEAVELDRDKRVEISLNSGVIRKSNVLGTSAGSLSSTTTGLSTGTLALCRLEVDRSHFDVALLKDEDRSSQVPCILLLILRQILDVRANEEDVGQIIELLLRSVGLLVHVSVEADVPTLLGPVGVRVNVQDLCGERVNLIVVNAE